MPQFSTTQATGNPYLLPKATTSLGTHAFRDRRDSLAGSQYCQCHSGRWAVQHENRRLISQNCPDVDHDGWLAIDGLPGKMRLYNNDDHPKARDHYSDGYFNFDHHRNSRAADWHGYDDKHR